MGNSKLLSIYKEICFDIGIKVLEEIISMSLLEDIFILFTNRVLMLRASWSMNFEKMESFFGNQQHIYIPKCHRGLILYTGMLTVGLNLHFGGTRMKSTTPSCCLFPNICAKKSIIGSIYVV